MDRVERNKNIFAGIKEAISEIELFILKQYTLTMQYLAGHILITITYKE